MPALSPTMTHGNIASWKIAEGARVSAGDVLADVETDKATMALESMEDGYLAKIVAPDGASDLPVGTVVGVMVEDEADVAAFANYVAPKTTDATKEAPGGGPGAPAGSPPDLAAAAAPGALAGGRMWPSVRRLLAESGLDPATIRATGPKGALVKGDVLAAMGLCDPPEPLDARSGDAASASSSAVGQQKPTAAAAAAAASSASSQHLRTPPPSPPRAAASPNPEQTHEDLAVTPMRSTIASRLAASKATGPHEYVAAEVSLEAVNALRDTLKASGKKASVNDCVLYAVGRALKASPAVNATLDERDGDFYFTARETADVAVAVAIEGGLITPVVRGACGLTLAEIGREVRALASKAREGRLKPSEYAGGSFTVSNLGMFPVDEFSAILNPPQVGIVAVGRGRETVVMGPDGEPRGEAAVTVTVSVDARVQDAAREAAEFLRRFKREMEGCERWALE
jgi:pyruvate dehydrogenase E2 component (dihydrolipoamide acetyltransferase)